MMMWSLRVMWPSIVEDMGHHWMNVTSYLVGDVMLKCVVKLWSVTLEVVSESWFHGYSFIMDHFPYSIGMDYLSCRMRTKLREHTKWWHILV